MAYLKAQSAMEYLITYGWAIIIIAVVLGALYGMGVFNLNNVVSSQCLLQSGFSCESISMPSSGVLSINLLQATEAPINITAIGCNTNSTDVTLQSVSPPVTIEIGGNATFAVQCYSGSSPFSGPVGSVFNGYLWINYTNLETGFPGTVTGKIVVKVS